jgi:hypothetical protein
VNATRATSRSEDARAIMVDELSRYGECGR